MNTATDHDYMPRYQYTPPPRPFMQKFAKQIGFGVICTIISTAIVQFAHIKQAVLYACSAVNLVGGDPLKGQKGLLEDAKNELKDIKEGIKEKVPNVHTPTLHKTPEQLETEAKIKEKQREIEAKNKEKKERLQYESERKVIVAKLEKLGVPFDNEASLEKLRVELEDAEEMRRKRPLIDHADKIGLRVDPKEPYDILAKRIKEAELDADYQEQVREYEKNLEFRQQIIKAYNARCPNPHCRRAFKTTAKGGLYRCVKCRVAYSPSQARAYWTMPPMPQPPKRKTGVLDRIKGLFG